MSTITYQINHKIIKPSHLVLHLANRGGCIIRVVWKANDPKLYQAIMNGTVTTIKGQIKSLPNRQVVVLTN